LFAGFLFFLLLIKRAEIAARRFVSVIYPFHIVIFPPALSFMENGKVAVLFQVKAINPFVISAPVAIGGNFAQDAQVVAFKSWNFKPGVSWICMEFVGIHFDLFCLVGLIPYFTIPHDFGNASSFFSFFRFGGGRGAAELGGWGRISFGNFGKKNSLIHYERNSIFLIRLDSTL
jgi:hypothetical protein